MTEVYILKDVFDDVIVGIYWNRKSARDAAIEYTKTNCLAEDLRDLGSFLSGLRIIKREVTE